MKKLIMLSLFTYTLSFTNVTAQGAWTPRTSLPDSGRDLAISFSIGNYGYAGLGEFNDFGWTYLNDFWQFDPSTNLWTRKADFPGNARVGATTFVIGNYAYVITGGEINQGYDLVTECWQYNSITDTWIQKNDFPGISRYGAVGFAIGNKGYLGTGYDTLPALTPALKDFWEYDTTTDTWTQKNNFGGIARYGASGFAVRGKGYVCFGQDSGNNNFRSANDMWEYDTGTDLWTQKSNNPIDSFGFASGFVIGNSIYVGTGQQLPNDKLFDEFWQYNTTTDTWTQQASYPGPSIGGGSAFAIADTGYMGLGVDSASKFFNNWNRFEVDSTTGTGSIKLNASENNILIYPNPFNRECFINLPRFTPNESPVFSLFNLEGIKQNIEMQDHEGIYSLERADLTDGVYILAVKFTDRIYYKKLVITY
jgi:N-acetylneuraminic acid mutarotase